MKLNIQLFAVTKSTTFAESAISIENNTSTLKITIKFSPNNDVTYFSSKTLNCTCNGVKKSASVSLSKGGSVTKSFTFTNIKHNTDGTKSVSWSWSCATGTSVLGTISDSGTKTLTTIQRYGKITNISGAITDSTITIDWHSYNANWVYDLEIEGYYTYRNIGSSVGDHTLNINVGNDFFNNSSTEVILPITYSLVTYPSDESWHYFNSLNTMIQLNEEAKPTISIGTITEADTTMQGLNWGVFVQNKSKLNIWTTSYGNLGSYVKKVVLTTRESNLSYSPSTDVTSLSYAFITPYVLGTSGTNTITAVSTDSRSRSSTPATTTLNVVAYSNPTITTATVQRCNQDKSLNDNGTYLLINYVGSISPVSNHNDKEFRIGYKKTTESSYTYVTLSSAYSVNLTNELSSFQVDSDYSYNIVFEAEDTFTTTKIDRLVEVGSDLINFNTNGKAMAIGKVSEAGANEELLEVALLTRFIPNTDVYNSIEIDSSNRNEASIAYFNQAKDKAYVVGYGTASFDGFGIYSAETTKNVMTVDKDGNGIFTNSFQTANYGLNGDFGLTRIFREMLGSSTGAEDADLDNFYDTGIYRCYPSTSHKPDVDISGFATYGICIVIKSYDWWYQIYIGNWGTPRIATRIKTGTNNWETWVGI